MGRTRTLVLVSLMVLVVPAFSGCTAAYEAVSGSGGATGQAAWPSSNIKADAAHDRGLSGAGVKVAIVDTGIDLNHPEFKGLTIEWLDLVNNRKEAYDDQGHGTHVAGIVAAQGTFDTVWSGFRMKGISPGVSLLVVKAIRSDEQGDESDVASGVRTATQNGADIIVLSLGGGTRPVFGTQTERAVNEAIDRGVFVVAAAGNTRPGEDQCTVTSPASVEGVIAVGAVDRNNVIARFSCHGSGDEGRGSIVNGVGNPVGGSVDPHKKVEVVAPGVDILSTWLDGGYASAQGTSQAAPMVGASLALLLEEYPELQRKDRATVYELKDKLMRTSRNIGPLGSSATAHDASYGYGLIDVEALLRAYA